jgi:hypothetical protein
LKDVLHLANGYVEVIRDILLGRIAAQLLEQLPVGLQDLVVSSETWTGSLMILA